MKAPDLRMSRMPACARGTAIDRAVAQRRGGAAKLTFSLVDLAQSRRNARRCSPRSTKALELPEHFGHNWDALADVLEDRDWLGKHGRVIVFTGSAAYRTEHPTDWTTLEDILGEAASYWKERHIAVLGLHGLNVRVA